MNSKRSVWIAEILLAGMVLASMWLGYEEITYLTAGGFLTLVHKLTET